MNTFRHREIAGAIIIDTLGRLLLQQRDNIAGIVHPGKVGLFGGHREGDETYLECVAREVREELSFQIPAERFEHLARWEGPDLDVDGGTIRADFFITRDVPTDALFITEGTLLTIEVQDLIIIEHNLAPTARFAIRAFNQRELSKRKVK
jgi:8-oxo-dGTP diphosphatase